MANETEYGNIAGNTDAVSDAISEAFVQAPVMLPLIKMEPLPDGTRIKLWRKNGSLGAEILAESTAYTFSAASELTQATVSSTAAKHVVVSKLTKEAERFRMISVDQMTQEQAKAIARDLDDEVKALTAGFSNTVTAGSTLTKDDLLDAEFNVLAGTAGVSTGRLITILDYKGANEVKKEISSDGGGAWANSSLPGLVGLLSTQRGERGFAGTFMAQDIYTTSGLPLNVADDVGLCYDPELAIAGMLGEIFTDVHYDGESFWWLISSGLFADFVEWNDEAGVGVESDT